MGLKQGIKREAGNHSGGKPAEDALCQRREKAADKENLFRAVEYCYVGIFSGKSDKDTRHSPEYPFFHLHTDSAVPDVYAVFRELHMFPSGADHVRFLPCGDEYGGFYPLLQHGGFPLYGSCVSAPGNLEH